MAADREIVQDAAQDWELVTLGVTVRWTNFCICCQTFRGVGMKLGSTVHCMACWQKRQKGDPCFHGLSGELRQAG